MTLMTKDDLTLIPGGGEGSGPDVADRIIHVQMILAGAKMAVQLADISKPKRDAYLGQMVTFREVVNGLRRGESAEDVIKYFKGMSEDDRPTLESGIAGLIHVALTAGQPSDTPKGGA